MTPISKALDEIKRTIPRDVLRIAFTDQMRDWRRAPSSLDDDIMSSVIRPRVLVDANIVGGVQDTISLQGIPATLVDDFTMMYEIPMRATNNRQIISVKSVGYLPITGSYNGYGPGVGLAGPSGVVDMTSAGQRLGDSMSSISPNSEAACDLIGPNTVVIRNFRRMTPAFTLTCMLSNDENLNNINPRSYHAFSKLCVLAVKSHIYNTLLIQIDKAYLSGGQELGAVSRYIENLSDIEEQYQTYLRETWQPIAMMNDTFSYRRLLKAQINPGL